MHRLVLLGILAASGLMESPRTAAQELPPAADRPVNFQNDIRPILQKHCWSCHGSDLQESGLRLDRQSSLLQGGDLGPVVKTGQSAESRLIHFVAGLVPDSIMPPDSDRLKAEEVGLLRAWIDQGVVWSGSENAERNSHWAYQPIHTREPVTTSSSAWGVNTIDHFVLTELSKRGLSPSPEASRYTLIRRLYLDLLGLLPPVAEVDAFVTDTSPEAYSALVNRLLASPHFGERWGRHWLDMARYADSDGYEKDNSRPDAYRWRDWVIDAINQDLPFDQFTIEQLAGDLLPEATVMQQLATAFHRQTLTNTEGGTDQEQFRVEACFDRTETTGAVWLGLTVGCARCHSHKYDAISQREYYQLYAFFNNGDEQTTVVPKSDAEVSAWPAAKAAHDEQVGLLTSRIRLEQVGLSAEFTDWEKRETEKLSQGSGKSDDSLPKSAPEAKEMPFSKEVAAVLAIPSAERNRKQQQQLLDFFSRQRSPTKELWAELDELQKKAPAKPEVKARVFFQRTKDPRTTYVLKRGEFLEPVRELEMSPGGLATLPPLTSRESQGPADRLDLARWLVSPQNPLTPRVTVNHIWRQLFGSGLVRTPDDFGVRGEKPTHPELLDWLAADFIGLKNDSKRISDSIPWSRKSLIRRIVMSATYRQSSRIPVELMEADPQNLWLARQNRLRVEGEIVRDISLNAAGLLSRKVGGPSVYPPLPPGIAELSYAGNFKWSTSSGEDRYRRGMYTFFKRTSPHPNLTAFDCPDANLACMVRQLSNTPLQALTSLNNDTFAESAREFAVRILSQSAASDESRLQQAFRICMARPASNEELQVLADLLEESRIWYQQNLEQAKLLIGTKSAPEISADGNAAWIATARILLNLDEFITRE